MSLCAYNEAMVSLLSKLGPGSPVLSNKTLAMMDMFHKSLEVLTDMAGMK